MEGLAARAFVIRWLGKVPAGGVNNEIVHIVDLYTTLAHLGGAEIPEDRAIDGVDQLDFFLGEVRAKKRYFMLIRRRVLRIDFYQCTEANNPALLSVFAPVTSTLGAEAFCRGMLSTRFAQSGE